MEVYVLMAICLITWGITVGVFSFLMDSRENAFVFGSLGDAVDHRKLYWLMAGLLAGALILYSASPGRDALMGAALLQGLATGGVLPMLGLIYGSRFGVAAFGRVMGLVNLFIMVGAIGSLFSGWMFELTGTYDIAFLTLAVLLVPTAALMAWLPKHAAFGSSGVPAEVADVSQNDLQSEYQNVD